MEGRACANCGTAFEARKGRGRNYCSTPCRMILFRKSNAGVNWADEYRKSDARKETARLYYIRRKSKLAATTGETYEYNGPSKQTKRRTDMSRALGISTGDYKRMYDEQGGLCAICRGPQIDNRMLGVDHNHQTNAIRGLLCNKCNGGLGYFNDSVEILGKAIEYLNRHKNNLIDN